MDKDFMLNYYDKMVRPIWTELMKTHRYQRAACERDKIEREFRRLLDEKLGRKYLELDDALFRVMQGKKKSKIAKSSTQEPTASQNAGDSGIGTREGGSNWLSRWRQKRDIRQGYYAAARSGGTAAQTAGGKKAASSGASAARSGVEQVVDKGKSVVGSAVNGLMTAAKSNAHVLVIVGVFLLLILMVMSGFSSCGILFSGGTQVSGQTMYSAEDRDIRGAEQDYKKLEKELDKKIKRTPTDHPGYNEYQYHLDPIEHDPWQLTSFLTTLYDDYTRSEVQGKLKETFKKQYKLTTWVEVQIRYKTVWVISPAGIPVPTQVPYEYKIFHTKLENRGLEVVIREELTEDQWQRYQIFQDTLGGRPYLFNGGLPPGGSDGSGAPGIVYTVPAEALTDTEFAAIYEEAKKYVGTSYVWGGSTPETGFDCSGYVCWVYNQNGYDVGRTTANGLWQKSQHISEAEAKPGDLVFFKGTYVDKLMNYIRYWQASGESLKTSVRTRTRLEQLTGEGHYTGGTVAFGYKRVRLGRVNKKNQEVCDLVIDEAEAEIVRLIFHKYVYEGYGAQKLSHYLYEQGVVGRNSKNIPNTSIVRMIKNKGYTGYLINGAVETECPQLRIIEPELFEQAQELRQARTCERGGISLGTSSKALLTGLVYCGHCGNRLSLTSSGRTHTYADGHTVKEVRPRYSCFYKIRHPGDCDGQSGYGVSKLDSIVEEVVRQIFAQFREVSRKKLLESVKTNDAARIQKKVKKIQKDLESKQKELDDLKAETILVIRGVSALDKELLGTLVAEAKDALETLEKQLVQAQEEYDEATKTAKRSNYICNELFTWADVYDTANHDERRAILQQFIKEIRVRKDYEISITLNASFNQVEQLKAVSTYDGAEIFEEISEKGA